LKIETTSTLSGAAHKRILFDSESARALYPMPATFRARVASTARGWFETCRQYAFGGSLRQHSDAPQSEVEYR
jgi:hypothetical protein